MSNAVLRRKLLAAALFFTVLTTLFALFGGIKVLATIGLISIVTFLWKLLTINPEG